MDFKERSSTEVFLSFFFYLAQNLELQFIPKDWFLRWPTISPNSLVTKVLPNFMTPKCIMGISKCRFTLGVEITNFNTILIDGW